MKTIESFANRYMKLLDIEINNYIQTMSSSKWESIATRASRISFHDGYAHVQAKGFLLVYTPTENPNLTVTINTSDNLVRIDNIRTHNHAIRHLTPEQREALEDYFIDYLYKVLKTVANS